MSANKILKKNKFEGREAAAASIILEQINRGGVITIATSRLDYFRDWLNSFGYMFDRPQDMACCEYNQQPYKLVAAFINWYGNRSNYSLLSDWRTKSAVRSSAASFFIGNMAEQYLPGAAFPDSIPVMNTDYAELSWDQLCREQVAANTGPDLSDNDLIIKITGGDRELFAELVKRYQKRIAALIFSLIQAPDEVEDITQDVFVTVYRSLDRFEFRSSFSTWIYRITINKCRDWQRKRYHYKFWFKTWDDSLEFSAATQDNVEDSLAVRQQVNQLDEKYRMVIILYYFQGLKCQEIAAVLGVSHKTVETRLLRARNLLAERLKEV